MTRRSDLMLEDIEGCDHQPETAVSMRGEVIHWLCRCGRKHEPGASEPTENARLRMRVKELEMAALQTEPGVRDALRAAMVTPLIEENARLRTTLSILAEHEPSWPDDFYRARAALKEAE